MFEVKVENVEAVVRMLRQYRGAKANAAVRKGTRAGCKIIAARARQLIPEVQRRDRGGGISIGAMRRAVKVRAIKHSRKGWIGSQVIIDQGGLKYTGDQFYAAFVEFGHRQGKRSAEIKRTQNAVRRGRLTQDALDAMDARPKIEGKHYFKRAASDTESAAIDEARKVIVAELSK